MIHRVEKEKRQEKGTRKLPIQEWESIITTENYEKTYRERNLVQRRQKEKEG